MTNLEKATKYMLCVNCSDRGTCKEPCENLKKEIETEYISEKPVENIDCVDYRQVMNGRDAVDYDIHADSALEEFVVNNLLRRYMWIIKHKIYLDIIDELSDKEIEVITVMTSFSQQGKHATHETISDDMGVSRQRVSSLIKGIQKKIRITIERGVAFRCENTISRGNKNGRNK